MESTKANDAISRAAFGLVLLMFALGPGVTRLDSLRGEYSSTGACLFPRAIETFSAATLSVVCADDENSISGDFLSELQGPARLLYGLRLDLNQVNAKALEALPGVGPARAQAIVQWRKSRPFQSVSELRAVHGIGSVTVEKLSPYLSVHEDGV
jgi:competence ComEA-like helix-hairpin-helix protein